MKFKFVQLAIIILLTSFVLHKYYVSVSEINYNQQNKRFEIALKVFNDDWQNALDRRLGRPVLLGSVNQFDKMDSLVQAYILDHYSIKCNGEIKELSILGYEIENEATWIYFYTSSVDDEIKEVELYNSMLTELFDEQRNVVQLKVGNESKSALFTKSRSKKTFSFK